MSWRPDHILQSHACNWGKVPDVEGLDRVAVDEVRTVGNAGTDTIVPVSSLGPSVSNSVRNRKCPLKNRWTLISRSPDGHNRVLTNVCVNH
jgi:hypothetical protein